MWQWFDSSFKQESSDTNQKLTKTTGEEETNMSKGKLDMVTITTPMAAAEVEETVHEDNTEVHTDYSLKRGPPQEEPLNPNLEGRTKKMAKSRTMKKMTTERQREEFREALGAVCACICMTEVQVRWEILCNFVQVAYFQGWGP